MKIFKTGVIALFGLLGTTLASETCDINNSNYKKVSEYSGCLPRPILFVHGVLSDMKGTWGAVPSNVAFPPPQVVCKNSTPEGPDEYDPRIQYYRCDNGWRYSIGGDNPQYNSVEDAERDLTFDLPYRSTMVSSYKSEHASSYIANKYGVSQSFDVNETNPSVLVTKGINKNGLEFYNADHEENPPADSPFDINYHSNSYETRQNGQNDQLYKRLTEVLDKYFSDWRNNANRKIDLVAHSQGGVVIRAMLAKYKSAELSNPINHINHIVTVNSPHTGVDWATDGSDNFAVNYIREHMLAMLDDLGPYKINLKITSFKIDPFGSVRKQLQYPLSVEEYYNMNGYFQTMLKDEGHPMNWYMEQMVPLTTLYSTAPGFGKRIYDFAQGEGHEMCDIDLEGIGSFTDDIADGTEAAYEEVCRGIAWAFIHGAKDMLYDLDESIGGEKGWTHRSDLVMSEESMQGIGVFSSDHGPFKSKKIAGLVPHGSWIDGYKGSNEYGNYIYEALENPPIRISIVPTIITPLLLN